MYNIICVLVAFIVAFFSPFSFAASCSHSKIVIKNDSSTDLEIIQHSYSKNLKFATYPATQKMPAKGGQLILEFLPQQLALLAQTYQGEIQIGHGSDFFSLLIKYNLTEPILGECIITSLNTSHLVILDNSLKGNYYSASGNPAEIKVLIEDAGAAIKPPFES